MDEREVDTLAAVLETLCARDEVRAAMGEAARAHAQREHSLARVAELYAAALAEAAGGEAVREAVLAEVAAAAGDVGIEPGSAAAAEIGARLRETTIGE